MRAAFTTDKIGLAAYLVVLGKDLSGVMVKTRNRAYFTFNLSPDDAAKLELDYTRSEHFRFYEAFRYLRDRTIHGG